MHDSLNSDLEKKVTTLVNGIQPGVVKVNSYQVNFSGGFMTRFTNKMVDHINDRIKLIGGIVSMDAEIFNQYLNTLLRARVEIANDRKATIPKAILKHLLVPAIHQHALNMIGWVQDRDTLEVFYPELIDCKAFLRAEQMIEFSGQLSILRDYGFECNPGLSLEKQGNLSFMTWTVVTNGAEQWYGRENKDAAPSEALFHSYLSIQQIDQVIRPRYCYGHRSHYDQLAELLLEDVMRKVSGR